MAFTVKDVRPDPVLTRLAVEFGVGGPYAADIIAPPATVTADTFKAAVYGREDIKRDVKVVRTVGSPAARVEFSKNYVAGAVTYRSLKADIPDEVRRNDPNGDTLDARRTKVLTGKLRVDIEASIAAILKAASNTLSAPGTKWDAASPKIRKNILDGKEAFRRQAGMYPNVMVLPPIVKTVVFSDTTILDLIRYTKPDFIENGMIPIFENMQVVSPGAIVDASNPGAAASIADLYDADEVYYLYVDRSGGDDLDTLTSLRQVRSLAASGQPFTAKRWRDADESANTEWVAVEVNQAEYVVSQGLILRQQDVLT